LLIDNTLRFLSAKVFLPATLLCTISIGSIASNGSGDSSGVKSISPSKLKQLDVLKSLSGLLKSTKVQAADADDLEADPSLVKAPSIPVRFSGYIRGYGQYRTMNQYYNDMYGGANNLALNGVNAIGTNLQNGYTEPFMMLKAEATPSSRTSVILEYYFDNQMTGQKLDSGRQALLYRLFNFKGNINTNFGVFTLTAGGGVNWAKMSPFTLWNYQNREDMFERWPWQPQGGSAGRYASTYEEKNIAVDNRWGRAGTQGFILEGVGLPGGFGFMGMYGKTDFGGFRSFVQTVNAPITNVAAGRIFNNALGHEFGINYFTRFGFTDGKYLRPESQKIITADFKIRPKNFNIYAEIGAGSYVNPEYKEKWSEAINLKVDVAKALLRFPLTVQLYSIGSSVVNVNSNVLNSSIPNVEPAYDGNPGTLTTFPGAITEIGQSTNNRRTVEVQGGHTIGNFKFSLAYSVGAEIDNKFSQDPRFNQIAYMHRLNSFTRSRFGYYQNGYGPYGSIVGLYRRVFERIQITDTDVNYKKSFNTIDVSLKYKFQLFHKDFIVTSYTNTNSAQDAISALPVFSDEAFVRYFYQEFMAYYSIHKKVTLVGFVGFDQMKANKRTLLADENGIANTRTILDNSIKVLNKMILENKIAEDIKKQQEIVNEAQATYNLKQETGKPRDQFGTGFGIGIDYDFAQTAGIYFRHRWFDHKDSNFKLDRFKGQESSVELKIFF
jgi:hypothetical protein